MWQGLKVWNYIVKTLLWNINWLNQHFEISFQQGSVLGWFTVAWKFVMTTDGFCTKAKEQGIMFWSFLNKRLSILDNLSILLTSTTGQIVDGTTSLHCFLNCFATPAAVTTPNLLSGRLLLRKKTLPILTSAMAASRPGPLIRLDFTSKSRLRLWRWV